MKKYYSMVAENNEANINIYGDITSWEWFESDVSSYTLSKELEALDVDTINVYINSYGGEVAEGLAIYNALKRHKAKIKTFCDGFACSVASVIFMAGDERIMSNVSLLMIHNAWTDIAGNAEQLRKQADDLETITQASINAYMGGVNITEDELKQMLDDETWISPQDALSMGFATSVINDTSNKASQNSKKTLMLTVLCQQAEDRVRALEEPLEPEPEPQEPEPKEPEDLPQEEENKIQNLFAALFR